MTRSWSVGAVLVAAAAITEAAPAPGEREKLVRWSAPLWPNLDVPATLGATAGVWSPDGRHVLTAGFARPDPGEQAGGEVRVWDAATGKVVHTFRGDAGDYGNRAGTVAISRDGKTVAAGGRLVGGVGNAGAFVEVWDWGKERPRLKLDGFDVNVTGVAFSGDGKTLAAVNRLGELRAWEPAGAKNLFRAKISIKGDWLWGLAFHPTRPVLTVAQAQDGGAWFFNTATGQPIGGRHRIASGGLSAAFSPDGKTVAYSGPSSLGRACLAIMSVDFPAAGGVVLGEPRLGLLPDLVYHVAFSPDGRLLAAACADKAVRLLDPGSGRMLAGAKEHTDFVYTVVFSPDGKSLLSVGRDAVKVWSVAELMTRKSE
jgi:WD40 repeat protein